jgi:hypothetical protein
MNGSTPDMDINARQEQFANAFLITVAAVAGFAAAKPDVDNDSVDWTIASRLPRRQRFSMRVICDFDQRQYRRGGSEVPRCAAFLV